MIIIERLHEEGARSPLFLARQTMAGLAGRTATPTTSSSWAVPALAKRICRMAPIHQGKRVQFYNVVDLVNLLEREKQQGRSGALACQLSHIDLVVLDELGSLPFPEAGGDLLFHLICKLYEKTSVVITTNLNFGE